MVHFKIMEKCVPPQPVKPGDLINAVRFSPIEKVRDLLAWGADANEKDSVGFTALMFAAGRRAYTAYARLLLDNGAAIDAKNIYGNTPLIFAADAGNAEIVEFLLDNGASPGERNRSGYTAQNIAEAKGHSTVAQILREAAEGLRALAAEKARNEASHTLAARRQEHLKKAAPRFKLK
jgi:ankyrin repeat protein